MHVLKENMHWKYYFVFGCLCVGIYCENLWDNDEIENHQVMLENRRQNGHYHRHSLQNDGEPSNHHRRILSDGPSNDESVPFGVVDRKNVRRMNLRRRKIGSSYNKTNIFRRGQRHRQNKNGKSFFKTTNQFFSLYSLHNQGNNEPF